MVRLAALVLCLALAAPPAAAQQSAAARWLMDERISAACGGRGGRIAPEGFVERDLTGDGRADLVISHSDIDCAGSPSRSTCCGMQVCGLRIHVREGDLLRLKVDMLSNGVVVGRGARPEILGTAHGGAAWTLRWEGGRFVQRGP